jgi:hypothetical protein
MRNPLGPVKTGTGERPFPSLAGRDVDAEIGKETQACFRHKVPVTVVEDEAAALESHPQFDSKSACEMVVARAAIGEYTGHRRRPSRGRLTGDGTERLKHFGDLMTCQSMVSVPALLDGDNQAPIDQLCEVMARSWRRNMRDGGQVAGRKGATIHHSDEHVGSGGIRDQGGNPAETGLLVRQVITSLGIA